MPQRPTSITVLSWLCIVFGVCGFLVSFDDLTTPVTHFGSNSLGMEAHMRDSAWLTRLYPYHSYSEIAEQIQGVLDRKEEYDAPQQ